MTLSQYASYITIITSPILPNTLSQFISTHISVHPQSYKCHDHLTFTSRDIYFIRSMATNSYFVPARTTGHEKVQASEVPKEMDKEARAKVGCHPSSLARMTRRSRQASNIHPANSRSLEELTLPPHLITSNSLELSRLFKSRTGFN